MVTVESSLTESSGLSEASESAGVDRTNFSVTVAVVVGGGDVDLFTSEDTAIVEVCIYRRFNKCSC